MTTPNGTPTGANPARPKGFSSPDASTQANPTGGGLFTGGSEAKVIGTDQDKSMSGAADATSGLAKQRANVANTPGTQPFTGND